MRPLPSALPDLTWRFHAPVRPDPYVRVDTCDYSVHPDAVGLVVEVRVTQREVVCVTKDGREVARHVRSFAPYRTITAAAHGRAVRERRETRSRLPQPSEPEVEVRDLAVYDRAFGVSPGDEVDQDLDLGCENGSQGLSEPRLLEKAAR